MEDSKDIEVIKYYRGLYEKYIPYISDRLWGSEEEGYGNPIEGINAFKFSKVGNTFSMYMLRLTKTDIMLSESIIGVFLCTELCSVLGNGSSRLNSDEQIRGVVAVCKVMLDDIRGIVTLSGLENPMSVEGVEIVKPAIKVLVPEGCVVDVIELWDGTIEYSVSLKNTYKITRDLNNAINSSSEGVEVLTLGSRGFDKRGILSYKLNGDPRGEVLAKYWSIMFKDVLEYFKENRKDAFLNIVNREILKGKRKVFVKSNSEGMDAPKYIGDGVYIEGHTSPNQIKSLLSILFIDLGLSLDDLEVYVVEGKNPKGTRRNL